MSVPARRKTIQCPTFGNGKGSNTRRTSGRIWIEQPDGMSCKSKRLLLRRLANAKGVPRQIFVSRQVAHTAKLADLLPAVYDVQSLTMSLRSRIGSEVAYAINCLGLLSSVNPPEQPFNMSACPDLFDEVAELLDEITEDPGDEQEASYAKRRKQAKDEEYSFRRAGKQRETFAGLDKEDLMLALLALLRNLSHVPENLKLITEDERVVRSLLRVKIGKKDVIQIIGNAGLHIKLQGRPKWVPQAIADLVADFITPPAVGLAYAFTPAIDAGLYAWSRIALLDANRRLLPQAVPFDTFMGYLPVADTDFQFLTSESTLLRVELVAMCLFNTACILGRDQRRSCLAKHGASLRRIVKKLFQAPQTYAILCQRVLEVIRMLSEEQVESQGLFSKGNVRVLDGFPELLALPGGAELVVG